MGKAVLAAGHSNGNSAGGGYVCDLRGLTPQEQQKQLQYLRLQQNELRQRYMQD